MQLSAEEYAIAKARIYEAVKAYMSKHGEGNFPEAPSYCALRVLLGFGDDKKVTLAVFKRAVGSMCYNSSNKHRLVIGRPSSDEWYYRGYSLGLRAA